MVDGSVLLGWAGVLVGVLGLLVAIVAFFRDNRHHREQQAELAALRKSDVNVEVEGSQLYPPEADFTIFDVYALVTNRGLVEDTIRSAFVDFPGFVTVTKTTALARRSPPGGLRFQAADHDGVYIRFKADRRLVFDLKRATLGLDFVRAGLVKVPFQAGLPGPPEKTSGRYDRRFQLAGTGESLGP